MFFLAAPEVHVVNQTCRFLKVKVLAERSPHTRDVFRLSSHLEVIDVDHEEKIQALVMEHRGPVINGFEAHLGQVCVAMLFPVPPCIWVAKKCKQ